jgi:hypothetical protein
MARRLCFTNLISTPLSDMHWNVNRTIGTCGLVTPKVPLGFAAILKHKGRL